MKATREAAASVCAAHPSRCSDPAGAERAFGFLEGVAQAWSRLDISEENVRDMIELPLHFVKHCLMICAPRPKWQPGSSLPAFLGYQYISSGGMQKEREVGWLLGAAEAENLQQRLVLDELMGALGAAGADEGAAA